MAPTNFWFKLCFYFVFGTMGTGFSCNAEIEKQQIKSGCTREVPFAEENVYSVQQTEADKIVHEAKVCGKIYGSHEQLISHGNEALYGPTPWNVAIYEKNSENDFDLLCSGTLISQNLVLSAAQCFWYAAMKERNSLHYKVGVGKYTSNFTMKDNEFTRMIDVKSVYIMKDYSGYYERLENDLAIVVLESKITLSDVVMPVCLDWNQKYIVSNGSLGKTVVRQTDENNDGPFLSSNITYIDYKSCKNLCSDTFHRFVTYDKVCASIGTGQRIGQCLSGTGMTLVFDNSSHYLTGVRSVEDIETSIVGYTDVNYHILWISKMYNKYS